MRFLVDEGVYIAELQEEFDLSRGLKRIIEGQLR